VWDRVVERARCAVGSERVVERARSAVVSRVAERERRAEKRLCVVE